MKNSYLLLILMLLNVYYPLYGQSAYPDIPHAVDARVLVDASKPLVAERNGEYTSHLTFYSCFFNHVAVEGGLSVFKRDSVTGERIGVRMINLPLMNILDHAYLGTIIESDQINRIVVESKRPMADLIPPATMSINTREYREWRQKNTWCYDLKIPVAQTQNLYRIMQEDIEKAFNIKGTYEKRKMKCLVLARISKEDKIKSFDSQRIIESAGGVLKIRNGQISDFVGYFKRVNGTYLPPIIDETGYSGKISIDIPLPITDLSAVRKELIKFGLELREEQRMIDVLVIRDLAHL